MRQSQRKITNDKELIKSLNQNLTTKPTNSTLFFTCIYSFSNSLSFIHLTHLF